MSRKSRDGGVGVLPRDECHKVRLSEMHKNELNEGTKKVPSRCE